MLTQSYPLPVALAKVLSQGDAEYVQAKATPAMPEDELLAGIKYRVLKADLSTGYRSVISLAYDHRNRAKAWVAYFTLTQQPDATYCVLSAQTNREV